MVLFLLKTLGKNCTNLENLHIKTHLHPSDISKKKLSHHFLLHFQIGVGSYDHHEKYQGMFPDLLENTFFIRVPPLDKKNLNEFKGGILMKKVFYLRSINTP